jgi:hypothetical protein
VALRRFKNGNRSRWQGIVESPRCVKVRAMLLIQNRQLTLA